LNDEGGDILKGYAIPEYCDHPQVLSLADMIRQGRERQSMSCTELATRAKVKRRIIIEVERGRVRPVRWVLCALVYKAISPIENTRGIAMKIVDIICPPRKKIRKKRRNRRKNFYKLRQEKRNQNQ
jgi:DNA-binding XRE family transcriptional regulator